MKRATYDGLLTKTESPRTFDKADGDAGEVDGYASKWWEVDTYGECTAPGCFAKSIAERGPNGKGRIIFRYEHVVTVGKHTSLDEDATGLRIGAFISDDSLDGTRLRRHLRDDIPYGLSIGFRHIRSRPATVDDPLDLSNAPAWLTQGEKGFDPGNVIVLEELKLLENSAVSFPAVDNALIDSYRADFDLIQRSIDLLIANAKRGVLRDDHITHLRALTQSLPAAIDPNGETPEPVVPQTAVTRRNYAAELEYALARHGLTL